MRKATAWAVILVSIAVTAAACKENVQATEVCKEKAHSAGECRDCCHENGAAGYKYYSACSCLN